MNIMQDKKNPLWLCIFQSISCPTEPCIQAKAWYLRRKATWQNVFSQGHQIYHLKATVYPKKYAHGFVVLCFVVVTQSFIMNSHEVFIHIHQGCFAGTGAIVRLPQCQWSKPGGYGKIGQCITTAKHSKAKTVCIFIGIYCMLPMADPKRIAIVSYYMGKIMLCVLWCPHDIMYLHCLQHMIINSYCISTHWGWDEMVAISQTAFSNAFCWMKMYEFHLRFCWNLFRRSELTMFPHCFR